MEHAGNIVGKGLGGLALGLDGLIHNVLQCLGHCRWLRHVHMEAIIEGANPQ